MSFIKKHLPQFVTPTQHDVFTEDKESDMLGQQLLRRFDPSPEFAAYMEELVRNDGENHLGIGWEFLGFIEDYYFIRQYLMRRHNSAQMVIVDVGCCAGLQQVLFKDFGGYIGIEMDFKPRSFSENASFIEGEFSQLVESGVFVPTDNMVGVANMSLLYSTNEKARQLFDQCFKQKIIV